MLPAAMEVVEGEVCCVDESTGDRRVGAGKNRRVDMGLTNLRSIGGWRER
jgi:hypothetical protein